MRNRMTIIPAVLLTLAAGCHKNPEDLPLPREEFTLTAWEYRSDQDYRWEWSISRDGRTKSVTEDLEEMTVTSYGRFVVTSDKDVNLTSSNPRVVCVTRQSAKEYVVEYVRDGSVSLTAWNGERANSVSFTMNAMEEIPIEGLRMIVGGKVCTARVVPYTEMELATRYTLREQWEESVKYGMCYLPPFDNPEVEHGRSAYFTYDKRNAYKIEFAGTVPLNSSYRYIRGREEFRVELGDLPKDLWEEYGAKLDASGAVLSLYALPVEELPERFVLFAFGAIKNEKIQHPFYSDLGWFHLMKRADEQRDGWKEVRLIINSASNYDMIEDKTDLPLPLEPVAE